ncbi:hypothetical protein DS745_11420 [Anaerobacillus alkaliphilus]|uniref:Copper resistance protein CopC n=1 Tax=Anaerobacillus alkaliphilus TaxID=1548597 RepID=A0A4Q0VS88_9BACI|nr:hypothetical protein DS745_11420 [Anaerobacillus alkaliphilus]
MKKIVVLPLFLLILLLPMYVYAHAYLKESYPTNESVLDYSPEEIIAQFSEPINLSLSKLTLKDEAGKTIASEQVSDNNQELILRPPNLENGVYIVDWQILAKDTHVTSGSFHFTVNAPVQEIEIIETPSSEENIEPVPSDDLVDESEDEIDEQQSAVPSVNNHNDHDKHNEYHAGTYVRILELLLLISIAGMFFFRAVLLKSQNMLFIERVLFIVASLIFILTGFTQVLIRALQLSNQPIVDTFLVILTTTNIGFASIVKPILFLVLFFASFYQKKGQIILNSLIFLGLFFSFAWSGHASGSFLNILSHTLHLAAASIWFGGIIGFTIYSMLGKKQLSRLNDFHKKLLKFSKIALWSIVVIIASGFILSVGYLHSWDQLLTSNYGITLLWKLLAFTPILIIAAYHRFIWLPKLKQGDVQSLSRLFWSLRIELILIIIVVIIAGFLSSTSPPFA